MKHAALLLGLLVLSFAAGTWIALESGEVVVLETRAPDGSLRRTRIWLAEDAGALWIEAATPERDWYGDLLRDPRVSLTRRRQAAGCSSRRPRSEAQPSGDDSGQAAELVAEPVTGADGHERIRALLRARYGWRDVWVGALQDTSRSVAVRLLAPPTAP